MNIISLIVPGHPISKERPRTVSRGGFHTYTPTRSTDFADMVRVMARDQMWKQDFKKIFKPSTVELDILFVLKGKTQPSARPDVNNLAANVLDGLQGAWIEDDCQVVKLHAMKMKGVVEGTLIRLTAVKESECQLSLSTASA